jgi:glycosyltransferase involved in cell wall biosynthesis
MLACERLDVAGGVERFVCLLADHLASCGLAVSVATVDTTADRVAYPLNPSVRVLCGDTPLPASRGRVGMLRTQWRVGRTLARLIRRDRPDVVVLNGLVTACSVLAVDRRFIAQTICCDHNHFGARSSLWQRLRAWLYPQVAAVVSLTEADKAAFVAINPRTVVIANASMLTTDSPAFVDSPWVLAIGRHVAQKGFDLLIKAWVQVLAARPDARLRIVGDGPLRADLQAEAIRLGIDRSVDWIAPTRDIEAHFRAAALFVLPSRYEGMPLALLEAQAMGLPAVAFDCPTGPRDILTADTGVLVPADDVAAFDAAIIDLLNDPERRRAMALAAIERSREHFSLARHFQRWTALIEHVARIRPA